MNFLSSVRLFLAIMMSRCNRYNFVCVLFLLVSDRRVFIRYKVGHCFGPYLFVWYNKGFLCVCVLFLVANA
jgi:hypothetical protein